MAVSLSAAGVRQLHGGSGPRDWRSVNGDLMGKKLSFAKNVQKKNNVKSSICMTLTGIATGEAKVSVFFF